jgi:guanylate kinase
VPDLAEQDDRRPLRAAARRARLVPKALSVLVVTGPSGVGKGTLIRRLLERCDDYELSVSATTRAPRTGEVDGRDYHFLTEQEFERRLAAGDFLEHALYAGNHYGTLRAEVDRARRNLVLEIEVEGARQVRKALPEAVQVFIAPPSDEALRQRLEGRATDAPDVIERRLARAREELDARAEFRRVIVNDDLDRAVDELVELAATIGRLHSPEDGPPAHEGATE